LAAAIFQLASHYWNADEWLVPGNIGYQLIARIHLA
jgi:hypothetical protein